MNERISNLIKQSMEPTGVEGIAGSYMEPNLEKLVELAVKECIKVIVNGGYWSGGILGGPKRPATPPEIAMMLKEHFGVES